MILVIFSLVGLGCASKNDDSPCKVGDSEILGCWETEICAQKTDIFLNPIDQWGKAVYRFKKNGEIEIFSYGYKSEGCTDERFLIPKDHGDTFIPKYTTDSNATELEGRETFGLSISFEIAGEDKTGSGYYYIENNRMCSSRGIQFTPEGISYFISAYPIATQIVEEYCLKRVNET